MSYLAGLHHIPHLVKKNLNFSTILKSLRREQEKCACLMMHGTGREETEPIVFRFFGVTTRNRALLGW